MIKDKNRNSSIAVIGAVCMIVGHGVYSNSTYEVPKINSYIYSEVNTMSNSINSTFYSDDINSSGSYIENKRDDSMKNEIKNNKIKSVNIVSMRRMDNQINDLGYYEYNEVENLEIAPRKTIKVKAKIKSAKRTELKLM